MSSISEAQKRAVAKYHKKAYDRIDLKIKKGKKQVLQDTALAQGESVNGYIKTALKMRLQADTGQEIDF